jgi:hypothetical protein
LQLAVARFQLLRQIHFKIPNSNNCWDLDFF